MNELEKLDLLIKSVNRGGYFRCPICNTVSNEHIATERGDFKPHMTFTHDPKDSLHFICNECADEIEDVRQDFEVYDEVHGIGTKEDEY